MNGKGFTKLFLKFMAQLENTCCESNNTLLRIAVENSPEITLIGDGTIQNPLHAELNISPFSNLQTSEFGLTNNKELVEEALAKSYVTNWKSQTTPLDKIWVNAAYSPELRLLAVCSHSGGVNGIMTSHDGISWTVQTTPVSQWRGIDWSPELGLFVVVGSTGVGNRVMTSPDGINWTVGVSAADNYWRQVKWIAKLGLFVAVSAYNTSNNAVMTSPDGFVWTSRVTPNSYYFNDIAYSSALGLIVAVASTGSNGQVITSPDGINWTARKEAVSLNWQGVCYSPELNLFVAVSYTGSGNRVMTSKDGINWEIQVSAADNQWLSVDWSPELGIFVAVCDDRYGIDNVCAMISVDGFNWETKTFPVVRDWRRVMWVKELGCFVVVAYYDGTTPGGNLIMLSETIDDKQQYLNIYGRNSEQSIKGDVSILGKTRLAVSEYADNTAALSAGLTIGQIYRTVDVLKIVH